MVPASVLAAALTVAMGLGVGLTFSSFGGVSSSGGEQTVQQQTFSRDAVSDLRRWTIITIVFDFELLGRFAGTAGCGANP